MSIKMCNHRCDRNKPGPCWCSPESLEYHHDHKEERTYSIVRRYLFENDGRSGEYEHGLHCDELMSELCPFREWTKREKKEPREMFDCPYCKGRHFKGSSASELCESWHKASEVFKTLKFENITWLPEGSREDPYGHTFNDMSMAKASLWHWMRSAVFKRDEYRCQICKRQSAKDSGGTFRELILTGKKDRWGYDEYDQMEVHHIIPRLDAGTDHPANLMTVCTSCHSKLTGDMLSNLASVRNFMDATANGRPIEVEVTEEEVIADKFGKGRELFREIIGVGGRP